MKIVCIDNKHFGENMLPVYKNKYHKLDGINIKNDYNNKFSINDNTQYKLLQEILSNVVGSDCWALSIEYNKSVEVIYNAYNNSRSYKEILLQNNYRDQIIDNPHSNLLYNINHKDEPTSINAYMYHSDGFIVHIDYNPEDSSYTISYSANEEQT